MSCQATKWHGRTLNVYCEWHKPVLKTQIQCNSNYMMFSKRENYKESKRDQWLAGFQGEGVRERCNGGALGILGQWNYSTILKYNMLFLCICYIFFLIEVLYNLFSIWTMKFWKRVFSRRGNSDVESHGEWIKNMGWTLCFHLAKSLRSLKLSRIYKQKWWWIN